MLSDETHGAEETDRLRFAISDSPVDTSSVYKTKENTLQKIYNYFRGRIKYKVKLDSHSILGKAILSLLTI